MTRLIILDFDGTLADTQPIIIASIQATLRELHLPERTDAECRSIIGLPLRECFVQLLNTPSPLRGTPPCEGGEPKSPFSDTLSTPPCEGGAPKASFSDTLSSPPCEGGVPGGGGGKEPEAEDPYERCADVYRRIFDELNTDGTVRLFPHVLETLKALHDRGLQLAICSSRGRPTLEGFVKTFRLEHYVSMVVSANDVEHHKPHPEPVQKILTALDIRPEEALVVGDASYDILMGARAGCRTVGVTYGNQSADELGAAGADWLIDDFAELVACLHRAAR